MSELHHGPISQGIRDAIKASELTTYELAKRVTARGRVKLTPPQLYRFLNNTKGLSLAVLDEISKVLHLRIRTLPPSEHIEWGKKFRTIFQDRLDQLTAIADQSGSITPRINALDLAYNSIMREGGWSKAEIVELFDHLVAMKRKVNPGPPPLPPRRTGHEDTSLGYIPASKKFMRGFSHVHTSNDDED